MPSSVLEGFKDHNRKIVPFYIGKTEEAYNRARGHFYDRRVTDEEKKTEKIIQPILYKNFREAIQVICFSVKGLLNTDYNF